MKLLLINHYAGSPKHGMEFRPFYLAREWVRTGHQALILGASYSHVRTTQPEPGMAAMSGVNYLFYDTPGGRRATARAASRTSGPSAARSGSDADILAREFAPDVVIASSTYPMDIWVARRVAKLAKAKLVYEVHDLWPLSPIELVRHVEVAPLRDALPEGAENDAYRDADVVVSMLPKVHQHMAAHGLDLKKLHIVPNGITLDGMVRQHGEPLEAAIQAHLDAERAAGAPSSAMRARMGEPNALDVLLDAAKLLKDNSGLSFVLVGGGHLQDRARSARARRGPHRTWRCSRPSPRPRSRRC